MKFKDFIRLLNQEQELVDLGQAVQNFSRDYWNKSKIPSKKLFNEDFNASRDYTFHIGGRKEIQFNVGLEGNYLRYGLAFSFEPGQDIPDPIKQLQPFVDIFNYIPISQKKFKLYDQNYKLVQDKKVQPNWNEFWFYGEKILWDMNTDCGNSGKVKRICKVLKDLFPLYKEIMRGAKKMQIQNKQFKRILKLTNHFKQIILQGPPGTSKTWTAKELTAHLLKVAPDKIEENRFSKKTGKGQWSIVQFHPSYNYEDFIRGIQIGTDTSGKICYQTVNRILGEMAEAAQKAIFNKKTQQSDQPASPEDSDNDQKNKDTEETETLPYILIIDEINRANLAAVLGELIYALEYRNEAVDTPYEIHSDFSLSVPPNLYIIGTMNTADRSVGHIDYAVRRRFVFIPCLPDATVLENYYDINHPTRTHLKKIALSLFHSVEKIFINDEGGYLTPDFFKDDVQVGHTYFMAKDCQELAMKFAYQVYPLLREYYKDGILIPREDGKIEIKIEAQSHPLVFKVDTPENCAEIFEQISSLCEEMSDSTASASAESAEEHSPDGENRESDPESFSEAEATQDDADQNDE